MSTETGDRGEVSAGHAGGQYSIGASGGGAPTEVWMVLHKAIGDEELVLLTHGLLFEELSGREDVVRIGHCMTACGKLLVCVCVRMSVHMCVCICVLYHCPISGAYVYLFVC